MMQRTLRACMVLLCLIPGMGQSCGYDALYPNPFEQSWPGTVNMHIPADHEHRFRFNVNTISGPM
ncbi:hypothetical protein [Aeromonas sp. JL9]|uniref:hypothetical protein n=1 Tax=Aeromonas sp. JL9 TaxID=2950549 RepID=UPI00210899FD|nr:hypothetical protein [Aeromonas sp. JL9]MCQ4111045.1 hypothetical protein [Aeromonas sp. JL9]